MKKKTLIIVLVAIVVIAIGISLFLCCREKNPLVGTWANGVDDIYNAAWTFYKDGKINMKSDFAEGNGIYKVEENKITITLDIWEKEKIYQFNIENEKLTLTPTDLYSPGYKELSKVN